jgi:hypothetical protein
MATKKSKPGAVGRSKKTAAKTSATKPKSKPADKSGVAKAKKLEALDAAPPKAGKLKALSSTSHPQRNDDFPQTYIKQIGVSLDDPDHSLTLTWTGPKAGEQETGPFRSSPGAGLKGLNCNSYSTSRRSGTLCTPKGTHSVQGFQSSLNSDSRATYVTWFVRRRGIAFHYFPSVPRYAASHGCVRVESKRIAQLIQSNSRVDLTTVSIDGTWTKPPKQW